MKFSLSLAAIVAAASAVETETERPKFGFSPYEGEYYDIDAPLRSKTGLAPPSRGSIKQPRHRTLQTIEPRKDAREVAVGEEREIPEIDFNERP